MSAYIRVENEIVVSVVFSAGDVPTSHFSYEGEVNTGDRFVNGGVVIDEKKDE